MHRCRTALAAALVLPALGWGLEAAAGTKRLRTAMLPSVEVTLTRSDVHASEYPPIALDGRGRVVPRTRAKFGKKKSTHSLSIAEQIYTLRRGEVKRGVTTKFFLVRPGGASFELQRKGSGFQSVTLRLPGKRRYVLAFPTVGGDYIDYCSGTVQTAKIARGEIRIYDNNTDGFYTAAHDTFQVGSAQVFAPISEHFATPTGVYTLESVTADGSKLTWSRRKGKTGQLRLFCRAPGFEAHVAFGSEGAKQNLVTTSQARYTKVVPGRYSILYGLAYSPAKRRALAGIVAGSFKPVEVAEGGKAKVVLGAPFRLDIKHKVLVRQLILDPGTARLTGNAGEEYVSFRWKSAPTVKVVSEGKTLTSGKMKLSWGNPTSYYVAIPKDATRSKCEVVVEAEFVGFGTATGTKPLVP